MSLRYASRMAWRAAQAAVRAARQPPAPRHVKLGTAPAVQRQPQGGQVSGAGRTGGGLTGVSAEKAVAVEKLRRRRAEKDENVMHLVCWGPSYAPFFFCSFATDPRR